MAISRLPLLLILLLTACAQWQKPPGLAITYWRDRAVTVAENNVGLSASVLSRSDEQQIFGEDLHDEDIQSVWLEVDNQTEHTLWLMRSGTDPASFSPLEVSWSFHGMIPSKTDHDIDAHFQRLAFLNPVPPHTIRSGIIFTNPHESVRLLNVDLLGQGQLFPFTLFLPIPDDSNEEQVQQVFARLRDEQRENVQDLQTLRAKLEQLPCCTTNSEGTGNGAPLNLVTIGNIEDLSAAMVRRGYRISPVAADSEQFLYGRPPDVVMRKFGNGQVATSWIRAWVVPLRFQGKAIFLAQVGRPVGGRFSAGDNRNLLLHPGVDTVRNVLISEMMYSGGLGTLAFVAGAGSASKTEPQLLFDGSHFYSDGIRAVMFFVTRPRAISDVQMLDWYPALRLRELEATHAAPE